MHSRDLLRSWWLLSGSASPHLHSSRGPHKPHKNSIQKTHESRNHDLCAELYISEIEAFSAELQAVKVKIARFSLQPAVAISGVVSLRRRLPGIGVRKKLHKSPKDLLVPPLVAVALDCASQCAQQVRFPPPTTTVKTTIMMTSSP